MYSSDELFQRSREGNFGVCFPSCETTREINTKITLEWAQKQFVMRVHISFLTRHKQSIDDNKNDDPSTSSPCLTHSVFVCWWRPNRFLMTSQWPHNCDVITWIVISSSLDFDFIIGDIHGLSGKNVQIFKVCFTGKPNHWSRVNSISFYIQHSTPYRWPCTYFLGWILHMPSWIRMNNTHNISHTISIIGVNTCFFVYIAK